MASGARSSKNDSWREAPQTLESPQPESEWRPEADKGKGEGGASSSNNDWSREAPLEVKAEAESEPEAADKGKGKGDDEHPTLPRNLVKAVADALQDKRAMPACRFFNMGKCKKKASRCKFRRSPLA